MKRLEDRHTYEIVGNANVTIVLGETELLIERNGTFTEVSAWARGSIDGTSFDVIQVCDEDMLRMVAEEYFVIGVADGP